MTSVFCTSTSTPTDGSTRDERFDGQHRVEERRASAAVGLGNLDAHDAELEQLGEEGAANCASLVHLADERRGSRGRRNRARCRGTAARRRKGTVRAGPGGWRSGSRCILEAGRHGSSSAMHEVDAGCAAAPADRRSQLRGVGRSLVPTGMVSSNRARVVGCVATDGSCAGSSAIAVVSRQRRSRVPAVLSSRVARRQPRRSSRGQRRRPTSRPHATASRGQPPPAAGLPRPASTSSASTSSSPTSRQPGRRLQAERLRGHRGRQAADGRDIQTHQARWRHRPDTTPPRADPHRRSTRSPRRRAKTSGCSRCSSTTTTCARRRSMYVAQASSRVHRDPARPVGHGRHDVSARVRDRRRSCTRNHAKSSRARIQQFRGRKFDYTPRNALRRASTRYPDRDASSGSGTRCRCRRCEGADRAHGLAAEGRKALILVSEGYTNILPPQLRDPSAAMPGFGNPARQSAPGGNNQIEDRARVLRAAEMDSDMREVYDAANQNNMAHLRRRSARPRGLRVRHQRRRRHADRCDAYADDDAGHAAHAGDRDRRPRNREPQRSRRRR